MKCTISIDFILLIRMLLFTNIIIVHVVDVVNDRFYIAFLSALEQTHRALVAGDSR